MKFAADAMLGKLAVWLRLLGFDTSYLRDIEDDMLVDTAREEGRLLLTRDTVLVKKLAPGEFLFIRDDSPSMQLRQTVRELGLALDESLFFSRCTRCNVLLKAAEKESVRGKVPEFTFGRMDSFMRCPSCGRVYWRGTHWKRVTDRLREIEVE
ncbi:MAG: Mut7-C RNAse domain-containing protein [Nitrospirota bacterium]